MGIKKQIAKDWTEERIIDVLNNNFLSESTTKYKINNLYVFDRAWESDYLALTKSGYLYEGEVKISRSDFKADMKKKRKHQVLEGTYQPKEIDVWEKGKRKGKELEKVLKPHYFFYAVPEGLIDVEEVPEYAGLVYLTDVYPYWKWAKTAPKLHGDKFSDEELNLTEKFYYNMISWRNKALFDYKRELDSTRQLLKEAKTDVDGVAYPHTAGQYKKMYEDILKEKMDSERYRQEMFQEVLNLRAENRILRKKIEKNEK